jgi:hypothetical protein
MNPDLIVPIVALITIFGMPVAIVYVLKHFKVKERELALQERELSLEAGSDAGKFKQLEVRLDRMERLLGSVEAQLRALPPSPAKAELYLPPRRPDETKD